MQMGIKVYVANAQVLAKPVVFEKLYGLVGRARQNKIDKFRFKKDKALSLAAGLLLEHALGAFGVCNPQFECGEYGKPKLCGVNDIHFNISHSGELAICAVAAAEVGCDVEKIEEPPAIVIPKVFVPSEQEYLNGFEGRQFHQQFYRLWTAKESFVKMTGQGLSLNPLKFSVNTAETYQVIGGRSVSLLTFLYNSAYQISVCVEGFYSRKNLVLQEVDLLKKVMG